MAQSSLKFPWDKIDARIDLEEQRERERQQLLEQQQQQQQPPLPEPSGFKAVSMRGTSNQAPASLLGGPMSFAAPPFGGGFKFGSRDAAASGALPAPGGLPYAPLAPPPPFKFASTLQPSAAPRAAQAQSDPFALPRRSVAAGAPPAAAGGSFAGASAAAAPVPSFANAMPPPPPPPRKAQPPAAKGGQAAPAAALLQPVQTRAAPFGAPPEASGGFGVRARPPPASPSGPAFGAAAFAQKRAPLSGGGGAAAGAPFVLPSWSPPPLQSQDGEAMMLSRAQDADLDGAGAAAAGAVAAVKPPPDPSAGCLSAVVSRLVEGGHAGAQPLVVGGGAAASAADDAAGSTAAIVAAAEARLLQLLPAALAPDKGLSVEGSAVAAAVAGLGERANVAQASGAAAVDAFASHTRGAVFEALERASLAKVALHEAAIPLSAAQSSAGFAVAHCDGLQRFLGAYDPLGAASLADLKASVAVAAVAADATHSAPTEHERVMEELARRRVAASARYERSSDRYELALGNSVNKPPGGAAAASQLPGPVVPAPAGGAATVGAGTLARLMLREEGFQWTSAGCAELEASGLSRAVFGPAAKALAAADGSAAVASLRTSPAAAALPPPAGGGGSAPGCMPLSPPRQLLPVHGDTAGMAGAAPALVGASAAAAGGRGPPPRDVDMPPSDGRNAPFLAATGASAEGSAMRDDDGGAGLMSATF